MAMEIGAANTYGGTTSGAAGQTQIINGKQYAMYTPAWQQAVQDEKIRQAGIGGTAAGTAGGDALKAFNQIMPGMLGPSTATGSSGPAGSGGGQFGTVQWPSSGPFNPGGTGAAANLPPPVQFNTPDVTAAQQAQFGRAKDMVGQESSGALTGLRSALASRGLLGSGAESRGTSRVFTEGQGQLGDVTRQQAMTAADLAEKQAELQYTGGISQRGQDIGYNTSQNELAERMREALFGGNITQRGQDIGMYESDQNRQLQKFALSQNMVDKILMGLGSLSY